MRLRLCGSGLVAALALVATGCGGGGSDTGVAAAPISFERLARSARTSADATSGRFSFDMSLSAPGADEPFALSGEGAFDARSKRASMSLDLSSLAKLLSGFLAGVAGSSSGDLPKLDDPEGWKIQVVQDGSVAYVRFPALDDKLPAGKSWIRGDENGLSTDGFDFGQFTNDDPRQVLDVLRAVTGDVQIVGTEELHGAKTTHDRAVIDPARVAKQAPGNDGQTAQSLLGQLTSDAGLADIPVDVWLDSDGLVRKLTLALTASDPATSLPAATVSFELWDYGRTIGIDVPPGSQVVAAAALHG